MTILVVEDDQNVLTLVERLLTSRGHTVLAASDPDHAGFIIEDHGSAPDVLLADIILAGRSGIDYAKSLKTTYPQMKVVFMTGWAHRAPSALRTGMGPVLSKPFTAKELYEIIEK